MARFGGLLTLLDIEVKTRDEKYAEAAPDPNSAVENSANEGQQTYYRRVRQEGAHLTRTTQGNGARGKFEEQLMKS